MTRGALVALRSPAPMIPNEAVAGDVQFKSPRWLAQRWGIPLGTLFSKRSRGELDAFIVVLGPRLWRVDPRRLEKWEAEQRR